MRYKVETVLVQVITSSIRCRPTCTRLTIVIMTTDVYHGELHNIKILATCWYLSGVCALSTSRDIAQYLSTSVLYGKNIFISVDFTDTNIVDTSTRLKQETINFTVIKLDWLMFSCAPECSKQLPL